MKHKLHATSLTCLALLGFNLSAVAGLHFVETSDIESNLNTPTHIGTIDVGCNTVSGTLDWNTDFGSLSGDDGDAIQLTVPSGVSVLSIKLEIYDYQSTSGEGTTYFRSFDNSVKFINNISGNIVRSDALGSAPPAGPTNFAFEIGGFPGFDQQTFDDIGDASFSYRVTIIASTPMVATTIARAHLIRFQSQAGVTYALQTTEDFVEWCDSNTISPLLGDGSVLEFCVEALKPLEFYRVRTE